jgi:membrane protease YdiL (CAAX protease family)
LIFQIIPLLILIIVLPLTNFLTKKNFTNNSSQYYKVIHYISTIVLTWTITILVVLRIRFQGKSLKIIGINFTKKNILNSFTNLIHSPIGLIAAILSILILVLSIKGSANIKCSILEGSISAEKVEILKFTMPSTIIERLLFLLIAASAGICEEIIYRGFLKYYLSQKPFYITGILFVILSSLIFVLPHMVQGFDVAVNSFILGILWATIYQVSASLILIIIIHILYDSKFCFISSLNDIEAPTDL